MKLSFVVVLVIAGALTSRSDCQEAPQRTVIVGPQNLQDFSMEITSLDLLGERRFFHDLQLVPFQQEELAKLKEEFDQAKQAELDKKPDDSDETIAAWTKKSFDSWQQKIHDILVPAQVSRLNELILLARYDELYVLNVLRSSDVSEAVKDLKVTPKQLAQVEQATSKALDEYFTAMRNLQEQASLDQQRLATECEARLLAPLTEQQQQKFRELFGRPLTKSDQEAGL